MKFKNLHNSYQQHSCPPVTCQRAILAVGQALRNQSVFPKPVALAKATNMVALAFTALPPHIISNAAPEIGSLTGNWPHTGAPDSPMLYIFHKNGHLRQAALRHVTPEMLSPFLFAAIVTRLNDWAAPVRQEAARCLGRITARRDLSTIAPAIPFLCLQSKTWLRWEESRAAYDRIEASTKIAAYMASHLSHSRQGPLSRQFHTVLRNQSMDIHLPALVTSTAIPAVRATALSALLNGITRWPIGQKRQWIDKVYGKYRLEILWKSRPVAPADNKHALALTGAKDRAVTVRRIVAAWLLRSNRAAPEVAAILADDTSATIRHIISIYSRKQSKHD